MDSLTVTISSPTHTPHLFSLTLSRQCSILELKEIIAARLDSKPTKADQRLIFGGRVLDDKDTLERVFEKIDCSHSPPTIHVVVSHRLHMSAPASPSPLRFRESTTPISTPSPRVTSNMSTAATSGTNLNTRHSVSPFGNTATHQGNRAESGTSSTHSGAEPPLFAAGQGPAMSALFDPAQSSMQQPMQYVIVNGMPYLVPAASLPILHHQHCMQQAHSYYGAFAVNAEGTPYFHHAPAGVMGDHAPVRAGPAQGAAAVAADGNVQDNAARDQRRAASLWLLMKLAFGVYLFSQNGSIERIVLLHIAALIIFLHQTGRLRIVRRIGNPPGDAPQHPAPNAGQHAPVAAPQTHTTTGTTTTTTTSVTSSDINNPSNGHLEQSRSHSTSASASGTDINSTGNSSSSGGSSNIHTRSSSQSHTTSTSSTSTAAPESSRSQAPQTQQTQDVAQQPRVSTWRSIEHALLTFVTSLVPAPPPDIDPAAANAAAGERGM